MESRDVMNIHVVEHSILNGIEYCTFWFRSVVEMTRHQLLLQKAFRPISLLPTISKGLKAVQACQQSTMPFNYWLIG
jgi:hypothetical protein